MLTYPFTEADARRAHDEWGANCGPNALAFFLQVPLDVVRGTIPDFEEKRYTSPTMMRAALTGLGRKVKEYVAPGFVAGAFMPRPALVRVQFTGPWTAPGANPRWAYRRTHWVVTWSHLESGEPIGGLRATRGNLFVFDCNGGIRTFDQWKSEIVPALTARIKRADGGWHFTHVWRVEPC